MTEKKNENFGLKSTRPKNSSRNDNGNKKPGFKKPFHKGKKGGPKKKWTSVLPKDNAYGDVKFKKKQKTLEPIEGDNVRVITIGGVEEVGKNMTAIEFRDSIYVFDAGFQFSSDYDSPGIDYVLPNTTYLEENKHKVKALIITHAHLDHIGGIPYMIEKIGNPPIWTRNLTALLIKKRMEEFPEAPKIKINVVEPGEKASIGDNDFRFFEVTHSIPDSMGISVSTPHGNVIVTGDLKLNHVDGVPTEKEEKNWAQNALDDNILIMSDSTNCENPGWSITEKQIHQNVEDLIGSIQGRIIIAAFASQFERMVAFVKSCEKLGKKVALEGRSIKTNMEIAKEANYFTPQDGTIIPISDVNEYPSDRVVIIATGSQGEEFAALPRMSRDEHKFVKLNERDTIILSSSVIPGNEVPVRNLTDKLMRHDVKIIQYRTSDVHSTGHGNAEELKWIIKKCNAKFFVPGYGFHSMLKEHKKLAIEAGTEKENCLVPDNGSVIEIRSRDEAVILKEKVPSTDMVVDGYSISDIQHAVLNDRKTLSQDGIFVVVVSINVSKKALQKSPDIISRGFVYLRESQNLLSQARSIIRKTAEREIEKSSGGRIEVDDLKKEIHQQVERFLTRKTNKKPIIIPVVLVM